MTGILLLVLLSAATYRLTRLATMDDFPPIWFVRFRIMRFAFNPVRERWWSWLGELVSCPWCASGWISLGVVVATDRTLSVGLPLPVLWWFSVWGLGAILINYESRPEPDVPDPPIPAGLIKLEQELSADKIPTVSPKMAAPSTVKGEWPDGLTADLVQVDTTALLRYAVSRLGAETTLKCVINDLSPTRRGEVLRAALTEVSS